MRRRITRKAKVSEETMSTALLKIIVEELKA